MRASDHPLLQFPWCRCRSYIVLCDTCRCGARKKKKKNRRTFDYRVEARERTCFFSFLNSILSFTNIIYMADDSRRRTVKVAIIGSGLAGLSSAYMLSQANDSNVRFEPHLFEKNQELGMDAASITTPTNFRIDVIALCYLYYVRVYSCCI